MSTTAPISERTITAVLLELWRAGEVAWTQEGGPGVPNKEVSVQELLRKTLAPLPDIQQALAILEQRGCLLERSPPPHHAVRLVSSGLPCWRDILEDFARRHKLRLGRRVMVFGRTASTNDIAWQCAGNPDNDGLVVIADEQTSGRGRHGHAWHARAGQSALFSIVLRGVTADQLDRLTLRAGLATAESLERVACAQGAALPEIEIKWPNDLLVHGRKLGGILVETRGAGGAAAKESAAVLGIGINVTQAAGGSDNATRAACGDFPPELRGRAISIFEAGGRVIDRMQVVSAVLRSLDLHLGKSASEEDATEWLEQWKARCPLLGQRIVVRSEGKEMSGQVIDIDPLLGLVLRDDGGVTHFLASATTAICS